MANPSDHGLTGNAPEALSSSPDPESLELPPCVNAVDLMASRGLLDVITEATLTAVVKFSWNVMTVCISRGSPLLGS